MAENVLPQTRRPPKGFDVLVLGIASGQTVRASAQLAGISERNAGRIVKSPDFQERLAALRGELVGTAAATAADALGSAVAAMRKLLDDPDGRLRLQAARAIVETACKLGESAGQAGKMAELEKLLEELKRGDNEPAR